MEVLQFIEDIRQEKDIERMVEMLLLTLIKVVVEQVLMVEMLLWLVTLVVEEVDLVTQMVR